MREVERVRMCALQMPMAANREAALLFRIPIIYIII